MKIDKSDSELVSITNEILHLKKIETDTVFEIGRRLKHVKEKDLTHGQWIPWLETVGIDRSDAVKYIRVVSVFPNVEPALHLNKALLFELLPIQKAEEFIEKEHLIPSSGEIKKVEEMTRKELREVKKTLKEQSDKEQKQKTDAKESLPIVQTEPSADVQYDPWVKSVADALQNAINEINELHEDKQISLEQLVEIGRMNIETQKFLATIIPKYGFMYSDRVIAVAIKLLVNRIKFNFVSQACNSIYGILSIDFLSKVDNDEIIDDFITRAEEFNDVTEVKTFFTNHFNNQSEAFKEELKNHFKSKSSLGLNQKSTPNAFKIFGVSENDKTNAKKQYQNYMKVLHPDNAKKYGLEGTEHLFQFIKELFESIK